MQPALIDTDIVSLFLRNHDRVRRGFAAYTSNNLQVNLSIVTIYEVRSGLAYRDAKKQLQVFEKLLGASIVHPLTAASVERSAALYGLLRREGRPLDDLDLLIAGIALAKDMVVVTHNRRHFDRIEGLRVEDWSFASPG